MSAKRNAARAFGGLILFAEVIVLVVLAYLTAFGNVDILAKVIPARLLAPHLLLIYMLAGLILLKYGSSDTPDLTAVLENQLRLTNEVAKVDDLRAQNVRLEEHLATLDNEQPRVLSKEAARHISDRVKKWAAHQESPQLRRVIVGASPNALDAKGYASQIRLALESGQLYSDDVWDFTWGDAADERESFKDENQRFLLVHEANVTVWGSDISQHDGEPLDRVLVDALKFAGVDVTHQPGPTSIGGMVAVIVGAGIVTEATREAERLRADIETLRPRRVSAEQQDVIYRSVVTQLPFDELRGRSVWVVPTNEDQEVQVYAHDFLALLQRMEFQAKGTDWSRRTPLARRFAYGLTLYSDDEKSPSTRTVLNEALIRAGLSVAIADSTPPVSEPGALMFLAPPTVHLVVGYRPM